MILKALTICLAILGMLVASAHAEPIIIEMHYATAEGIGKKIV